MRLSALLAVLLLIATPAAAEPKLKVVATFSILGDLVANVGGDRVDVAVLVGPDTDAHTYQPKPSDARTLAAAQVLVSNGLGFEGWIDRLAEAAGLKGLFMENMPTPNLVDEIARDSGASVGPRLYSDALSKPGGPAATYEAMMRHNVTALVAGMLKN